VPLTENTLFGDRDKVQIAIERLCTYEPVEGYHLAFSGGKDSVTIKKLAEIAGVQFDTHYQVTTVDPPELIQFIKEKHPDVQRHRPEMSMFQYILKEQWPPTRIARYCCRYLKERGGEGRVVVTGIRWAESPRRKRRSMVEACTLGKGRRFIHPIIDWTDSDVWEFIGKYDVPYCSLYDEGFERLGCVLCPMITKRDLIQQQIDYWPKFVKAYTNTLGKLIVIREKAGKKTTFRTGEEFFHWWTDTSRKQYKGRVSKEQLMLFE
jgi:phosphoadenosine phosphosulfate reductase